MSAVLGAFVSGILDDEHILLFELRTKLYL